MPDADSLVRPGAQERGAEAVPAERRPRPPRGVPAEGGVRPGAEHRLPSVHQQRLQEDCQEDKGEYSVAAELAARSF